MEWIFIIALFCLFVIAGAIQSFRNRTKLSGLLLDLELLRRQVNLQAKHIATLLDQSSQSTESSSPAAHQVEKSSQKVVATSQQMDPSKASSASELGSATANLNRQPDSVGSTVAPKRVDKPKSSLTPAFNFDSFIQGNGLLWLGGIVLALGGIFLAKYSIEAGLIPAHVRVIMAGVFGVVLVVTAEYLYRNNKRFKIYSPYVSAALASGGVITCYAIAMVAYDHYGYLTAQVAFGLLAVVSLSATSLALRFGPLLAWIGIVGAYAVPLLVSTGSNNISALLIYTALVSASAIWVSQVVRQTQLWWLSFIAHFLLFAMSLSIADNSHFTSVLIFVTVSIYLFALSDILGWSLRARMLTPLSIKDLLMPRKEQFGVLIPLLMLWGFLTTLGTSQQVIITSIALFVGLCCLPIRHSAFDSWPFLVLASLLYAYILLPAPASYADNMFVFRSGYLFAQVCALVSIVYSVSMYRRCQRPAFLLLLVLAPISLFGLSYALSPAQASQHLYPVWGIELALLAIVSAIFAVRATAGLYQISLLILANACITLCMTMLLGTATLSLAIAIQIASMSYLGLKYGVALPDWLYKATLTVVVARLTFAPWLDAYSGEQIFGLRWTLIIYPIVLGVLWFARVYNRSESFRRWLEGAFIHVLALFVTTETSFLLVGQYPEFFDLSFQPAALLAVNWLILAGVYLYRAKHAAKVALVYQVFAVGLMIGASLIHLDVSVLNNPFLVTVDTGEGAVINWLLVLWAAPALLLVVFNLTLLIPTRLSTLSLALSGLFAFLYINGAIRGAYHQGKLRITDHVEQAELYTYSIVWLVIATAMVFIGQHIGRVRLSNLGFIVLASVLLKAFLVDMANLQGLYRAISFIGLGISLVGIGWLFQKLNYEQKSPKEQSRTTS